MNNRTGFSPATLRTLADFDDLERRVEPHMRNVRAKLAHRQAVNEVINSMNRMAIAGDPKFTVPRQLPLAAARPRAYASPSRVPYGGQAFDPFYASPRIQPGPAMRNVGGYWP